MVGSYIFYLYDLSPVVSGQVKKYFTLALEIFPYLPWGGRVVRWCWVNFQCWSILLILIKVGQGPTALAVGVGGDCLDIFSLIYHFSFLSPSLWETARYRLKYCLKGPLNPKQPTNLTCPELSRLDCIPYNPVAVGSNNPYKFF